MFVSNNKLIGLFRLKVKAMVLCLIVSFLRMVYSLLALIVMVIFVSLDMAQVNSSTRYVILYKVFFVDIYKTEILKLSTIVCRCLLVNNY